MDSKLYGQVHNIAYSGGNRLFGRPRPRAKQHAEHFRGRSPGLGEKLERPQKRAEPKKKVDEKEYDAALKSIPDAPKKVDPWGKLR